jgi:hypothetical protein
MITMLATILVNRHVFFPFTSAKISSRGWNGEDHG